MPSCSPPFRPTGVDIQRAGGGRQRGSEDGAGCGRFRAEEARRSSLATLGRSDVVCEAGRKKFVDHHASRHPNPQLPVLSARRNPAIIRSPPATIPPVGHRHQPQSSKAVARRSPVAASAGRARRSRGHLQRRALYVRRRPLTPSPLLRPIPTARRRVGHRDSLKHRGSLRLVKRFTSLTKKVHLVQKKVQRVVHKKVHSFVKKNSEKKVSEKSLVCSKTKFTSLKSSLHSERKFTSYRKKVHFIQKKSFGKKFTSLKKSSLC